MMVTPLVDIIGRHRRRAMDGGTHRHRLDGTVILLPRIGMESVARGTTGIIVGPMTGMTVGKTMWRDGREQKKLIRQEASPPLILGMQASWIFRMQVDGKQGSLLANW